MRAPFLCAGLGVLLACGSTVETSGTGTGGMGGASGSTTASTTAQSSSGMGGATSSSSSSTSSTGDGGGQACYECACTDCFGATTIVDFGMTPCFAYPPSTCEGLDGGTDGGPPPYQECVAQTVTPNCI